MCIPLVIVSCILGVAPATAAAVQEPQPVAANQNRIAAGTLRDGVLTLALEARTGMWRPQSDDGGGVVVQAFAEAGRPLQNPGPLVRVRAGTRLDITVPNTLDSVLVVYGLHSRPGSEDDTIHIAPRAVRSVSFTAGQPRLSLETMSPPCSPPRRKCNCPNGV
jgi:manganese oxidase